MKANGQIIVIGSLNMDLVYHVTRFPQPGETVHSTMNINQPGGKGANQAVAAARMGADVMMVGAVGKDGYGDELVNGLQRDGIQTDYIFQKDGGSGTAFITVDATGENQIVLAPGANRQFSIDEVLRVPGLFDKGNILLLQNEIDFAVTSQIVELAFERGVVTFFNPAPATRLSDELLAKVHTLIVNETELEIVTGKNMNGKEEAKSLAKELIAKGCRQVLLTLGANGAMIVDHERSIFAPAFKVNAVDTTAAGDTFIGAFAASILAGMELEQSLKYASAAAAIAVTKHGAQSSIPTRSEVEQFLQTNDVN